jgi:hypothetical protein
MPEPILYQPFWCEENIWHLAQHPAVARAERLVVVITGARHEVACWHQRAGEEGAPVLWDYHVVLASRAGDDAGWQIWDLDGRLGYPVAARTWLRTTFPYADRVPAAFQPRFAAIPAEDYVARFGSDRSHMRDAKGAWLKTPPPWPALEGQGLTLDAAIEQARRGLDLDALAALLSDAALT